jgi:hypothetical protein
MEMMIWPHCMTLKQGKRSENCGLLKIFKIQNMRKEMLLLEHLIGLWDANEKDFRVGSQLLEIEIEDVYFLMRLSKRGAPIILSGHRDYTIAN